MSSYAEAVQCGVPQLPLDRALAIVAEREAAELQQVQVLLQETISELGGIPVAVTAEQLMRLEAWGMMFDFATGMVDAWGFGEAADQVVRARELQQ